ncbi:hypothetical protein CI1B_31950 [Bradyrhizobium ivorense]|uniref:Uncharacterized protein n=1 Tax=Bradyrhizobium ivorense TaxID=2511166 RepID=A0A508T8M6_9BRAD|nr:hypothetical protein [Bradyrhizobium ivorense]VIO70541.1 hypothetical protein CI1B_31950 [Bradyrhizobium ivorense]VIO79219.1 hypothetical protein CI41S_67870 [Bradyrhizobium ivorense]
MPGSERDLLSQPEGFDAEVYRKHFAPYPWTHIRGFRELFELLFLQPNIGSDLEAIEFMKGLWPQIVRRVPAEWRAFDFRNAHWSVCNSRQIEWVYMGKPARLDRSCHAAIALQIAFEFADNDVVRGLNVLDYLELVPATFALDNISAVAKTWLKGAVRPEHVEYDRTLFEGLIKSLCPEDGQDEQRGRVQKAKTFLSNVADGHALTFENADLIKRHLPSGWGSPRIVPLQSRKDGKRRDSGVKLRCCDFESEFVKLDQARFEQLRQRAAEARRQAG